MTNPLEPHPTWRVIDPSKIQEAQNCERQYFYEYILGWRSTKPNNDLHYGKSWHVGQEYLLLNGYEERHVLNAFSGFLEEYRKEFDEDTDALFSPKTPDNALKAYGLYADRFRSDLSEFEVLYTEVSGSVMLTEDVTIFFKLDSILKDISDGKIFSLEHKTSKRGGRQWEDQWALKCQMHTYTHVMKCLYEPSSVKGIKVRGTFFKKTQIDFEEIPLWKTNEHMQVWMWNTLQWIDRINYNTEILMNECSEDDEVMMAFPMNPENCTKYWGCAYHDFCQAWPNPLRRCEEPPLGFKLEFWDPRKEETTHKMEVR